MRVRISSRWACSGNVRYRALNGTDFEGVPSESVDFVFSYDVMMHLQPQNVFSHLVDGRRVLCENGVFMLHQINLSSQGGLQHFLQQCSGDTWKAAFDDLRPRGHISYMSVDQMETRQELGWEPTVELRDGLRMILAGL